MRVPVCHRNKGARHTVISGKDQKIDPTEAPCLRAPLKKQAKDMAHVGNRDAATVLTLNSDQVFIWSDQACA
ncbi:MAG: hypothetical protein EBT09_01040 [Actinobacteria bacterium]|nr:hypothetical protein [Actinomycetota bacterium]